MSGKRLAIIFIFVILFKSGLAQDFKVKGSFSADSVMVGEEVAYSVTIRYPRHEKIIFPDSLYSFENFEFIRRIYVPTRSDTAWSYDSVSYFLATFEVDSVQYLQLPVFLIHPSDCTIIYANRDSIILRHVITQLPDSIDLKANTDLTKVLKTVNYPLLITSGILFLVILTLVILLFGRKILRWYKVQLMKRKHRIFTERFFNKIGRMKDGSPSDDPEHVLLDWKKYMEKLDKQPYTKMTTREIIQLHEDATLKESLKTIDRHIYGNLRENALYKNYENLLAYAVSRFFERIKEVQHGS